MRGAAAMLALPLLAGCLSFDGRSGPGDIPKDADGVGYTNVGAAELAQCVAAAVGSTVSQNGNTYVVATQQVTYGAEPTQSAGPYPTQLVTRGYNSDKDQVIKVGLCPNGTPG